MNPHPVTLRHQRFGAFTLIELLTVIAIIGVLAAMLLTVLGGFTRYKYISAAKAELNQMETAIDNFHATYGAYPPSGNNVLLTPLYYELLGTAPVTNSTGGIIAFTNLDGSGYLSTAAVSSVFGAGGFVNCTKPSAAEDLVPAKNFLPNLKVNQVGTVTVNGYTVSNLVASVGGPDQNYTPLGSGFPGVNPIRYNSANPTNNPNTYDLWIDLSIQQKTNRVCNWSQQVLIVH